MVGGRVHRPVDGLLPGPGRPLAPHRRGGARGGGLRRRPVATADGARRCSPPPTPRWPASTGADAGHAMRRAMQATVDEVGAAAASRGHRLPTSPRAGGRPRPERGPAHPGARTRWPRPVRSASARTTCAGCRPDEARRTGRRRRRPRRDLHAALRGAQPARLVRGLADAVERRGVRHLRAAPRSSDPAPLAGPRDGRSPAAARSGPSVVVRATEGYTRTLPGLTTRRSSRCYSLMVATEPLRGRVLGRGRPGTTARPSPTTAT